MSRILGVHGIGQQYMSGPQLQHDWWLAIRGGLEIAGFRSSADALATTDVRVAFFGDLFRPQGAKTGGEPPYQPMDVTAGAERALLEHWYTQAVNQEPLLGPTDGSKGTLRLPTDVMLDRLLRSRTLSGVGKRAFIGRLKQVTAFLAESHIKERVLERVSREVTPETEIIIGHSLGSVVAYEYLARYAPYQVRLFVTLGSPLGIPALIFDRLTPPPREGIGVWPGRVPRWVNIADKNDIVAWRKQLSPLFQSEFDRRVEERLVNNGKSPHAIGPYLNARFTGQALGAA